MKPWIILLFTGNVRFNAAANLLERINLKIIITICLVLAAISIMVRIPDFERTDFHNSDATWHVLHTLRCYEQTPISIHKFLPIVTLGDEDDKFITWGATIPDKYGNYYYTSFSPAGFVMPYLFMKLFNIPISLMSLYVFNSILYILCFILSARLFVKLFVDIDKRYIWLFTAVIYLFQPEIMQGQGIVYWSQSLYQLIFLAQINLLFITESQKSFILLLLMCLFGAYTEWTGYCANMGIAVALFFTNEDKTRYIKAVSVIVVTGLAFALFCAHYLSVVSLKDFKWALDARFTARNFATSKPLWHLGAGYVISFALFGFVTFCLLLFCLLNKQKRVHLFHNLNNQKFVLIVFLFALFENVIMKQHAFAYSFDRMKFIFPLMILFFSGAETIRQEKFLGIMFLCAIINIIGYKVINTSYFMFEEPKLTVDQMRADSVNAMFNHSNSVMAYESHVRGYLNTLYNRGIYECYDIEAAVQKATEKGRRYMVMLYNDSSYVYIDMYSSESFEVKFENGSMIATKLSENEK